MENDAPSRAKEILRWVAVLPGAAACAFLAKFPIHWLVTWNQFDWSERDENGNPPLTLLGLVDADVLEQLAAAFLTPFIVILVGTHIAPRHRFQTAIVLAILLGVAYGIISTFVARDILEGYYNLGRWVRLGLTLVLCVGGIATGLFKAHQLPSGSNRAV